MLQFGKDTARKLLNGAAYFFEASDRTWTGSDFSDTRSTESQRFYNYLCIAYGGDQRRSATSSRGKQRRRRQWAHGPLPAHRAGQCPKEYVELKWAFDLTIMPKVDRGLLQKVFATNWLQPNDGK